MLASLSLIDQEKKETRQRWRFGLLFIEKKKGKEKKKAEEILRVRFWKGGHLSSSESGRVPTVEDLASKFSRGFNPPTDCLEVGLKQFGEKEKVCIGTGFICTSLEEENPRERGWCKAAITEFRCVLSLLE